MRMGVVCTVVGVRRICPANQFWESMGFVPLAFRGGSDKKKRVHIFWQKRIDGDRHEGTEARRHEGEERADRDVFNPKSAIQNPKSPTPYWYPFQTNGGAIRADRLVFPIPPGVHWKDVRAVAVPTEAGSAEDSQAIVESEKLKVKSRKCRTFHFQLATRHSLLSPARTAPVLEPSHARVSFPGARAGEAAAGEERCVHR